MTRTYSHSKEYKTFENRSIPKTIEYKTNEYSTKNSEKYGNTKQLNI